MGTYYTITVTILAIFFSIKYVRLIIDYNALTVKYIDLVNRWNDLVLSIKEKDLSEDSYLFTSNEIKLIMKKCHPDVNRNDYDNKELYNKITVKLLKMYEK